MFRMNVESDVQHGYLRETGTVNTQSRSSPRYRLTELPT
jgi:hypothetical protein